MSSRGARTGRELIARLAAVRRHERGPRLYVAGLRVHHGPGFVLLAACALVARQRGAATMLLAVAATDWRDFPFRDRDNH